MKAKQLITTSLAVLMLSGVVTTGSAETKIPVYITTPDRVESKIGTLQFKDGYPIGETAAKIRDELDYLHGVEAFMNSIHGVSLYALRKGLMDAGLKDNEVMIWTKLMDSKSLFLTANADTVYYMSFLDLSNGPLIFEAPPQALGVIDDMWFNWVTDFGLPGAERGEGGKYLLVGPGYDGPLPEGGFIIRKARTSRIWMAGRSFLTDNDPAPTVDVIKNTLKIYPYLPGGAGTSIGSFITGKAQSLGALPKPASPRFVEGTGREMNTIPPNDFGHYEMLNAIVQMEPAEVLSPELAGQFAAIGIVKGEKFSPDVRMRKILDKAVAFGNAASRTLGTGAHPVDHFRYYDKPSAWWNMLFEGGYEFLNPPPMITKEGIKPFPNKGARKLHSRTAMFYFATGVTPAMCMRLTGVGSQYLCANIDSKGKPFDGSQTYKVVLPKNIPAARFWSFTVYDNQSRSMLQTKQPYPRAGSQSYPSPAAAPNADGSTTIYFSPKRPESVAEGNWIQTDPKKGWFTILRLYSPL
ncbi:MAG: DUF1254 domain-containing protein, partial [Desulfobulbaceae bacterium]|nr:DUF1254 domain-containing protein [Desulfobulbaceae bacterium]